MRLLLTVLSTQRSTLGDRSVHTFDRNGGAIGRSAGCDWSLPDEKNTLSARHASVSHNGHGFLVTDTSTNGVYLNAVDAPLGRSQSAPLASGDTLYIGEYVISVAVLKEPATASPSPAPPAAVASHLQPAPLPARAPSAWPVDGVPAAAPTIAMKGDAFAMALGDILTLTPPPRVVPTEQAGRSQPAATAPPLPPPGRSAPVIPDDFDFGDLMPPGSASGPAVSAPPASSAELPAPGYASAPGASAPMPAAAPELPSQRLDPLALLRQRAIARAASIDLSEPTLPPPRSAAVAENTPLRAARAPIGDVALPGGPGIGGATDAEAFWRALGLDADAVPADARQDMLAELGFALREAASGLVAILSARKSMKDEFRIDLTRLAPQENNPFKFFGSGEEALRRVVVERRPGYLRLDRAVKQGFADIQAHEIAAAVAMQNALRKLLGTLDPAAIEQGVEPGLLGRKPDKSRLWDRFVETHGGLAGDLDRTMHEMLAEEFSRAYAQQSQSVGPETGP